VSVTGGPFSCEQTVGLFARSVTRDTGAGPFPVGIVASVCPERWELSVVEDAAATRQVLAEGSFAPGNAEHVYRLEVAGNTMRLFIDGVFAGEASDDRLTESGSAGIYVGGDFQVTISAFRIFEM
jgi:hypothetical protein